LKDSIDLKKENFKLAFAVRDQMTGEFKDNPALVEFKGIVFEKEAGTERAIHELDAHVCTKRDLKQFYDISFRDKALFDQLIKKKALYCLNYQYLDMSVFGGEN
jgi:hypothetical protein